MKLRLITFIAATMTALYAFAQHGEGKSNIAQLTSKDTLQSYKNMRLVWSDEFQRQQTRYHFVEPLRTSQKTMERPHVTGRYSLPH